MTNKIAMEQLDRLQDLAAEEMGIADALFILDVAVDDVGKAKQLFVNFSKWIYRHQKDLAEVRELLVECLEKE